MGIRVRVVGMVVVLGAALAGCAQPGGPGAPTADGARETAPRPNPSLDPPAATGKAIRLGVDSLAHHGKGLDTDGWTAVLLPEPLEGGVISVPGVCNAPSFTITSAEAGSWMTAKNGTEGASGCSAAGHDLKEAVIGALAGRIAVTRKDGKTILTHGGYTLTLSGP